MKGSVPESIKPGWPAGELGAGAGATARQSGNGSEYIGSWRRIRGKKQPLSSASLHALRDEYTPALADAEAELNARVYRLFNLSPDEVKLLQKEVEH